VANANSIDLFFATPALSANKVCEAEEEDEDMAAADENDEEVEDSDVDAKEEAAMTSTLPLAKRYAPPRPKLKSPPMLTLLERALTSAPTSKAPASPMVKYASSSKEKRFVMLKRRKANDKSRREAACCGLALKSCADMLLGETSLPKLRPTICALHKIP